MALPNVEQTYNGLLKSPDQVLITQTEAYHVWQIFKPNDNSVGIVAFGNFKNRAFMQAALASAVEGSLAIGWVEAIWRGSVSPNATVKSLLKKLAKHAKKEFWREVSGGEVDLYENVLGMIRYQCAHYFRSISSGLEI